MRNELVFEVTEEADGGYCAECLTENIFTQGDTWEGLRAMVKDAVEEYFFDGPQATANPAPPRSRLSAEYHRLLQTARI